jgi:hypothetical protein
MREGGALQKIIRELEQIIESRAPRGRDFQILVSWPTLMTLKVILASALDKVMGVGEEVEDGFLKDQSVPFGSDRIGADRSRSVPIGSKSSYRNPPL